jgi:osmotically-inducible protein OsmY
MKQRIIVLALAALCPLSALAQKDPIDLTAVFVKNGAVIEHFAAFQISDIVVLRGQTNNAALAEDAGQIATALGYRRVANLIVVRNDVLSDAAIEGVGQRRLERESSLGDCRFNVDSVGGVIRLTGRVQRDEQRDLAIRILNKIAGVKSVTADLEKSEPH